jgi:hypothetical protein
MIRRYIRKLVRMEVVAELDARANLQQRRAADWASLESGLNTASQPKVTKVARLGS